MSGSNGSTAVAVREDHGAEDVRRLSLADLRELGKIMAESNLFPDVRSAAQCVVKIMAGAEMGFGPFASMADVHIIEGKPAVGAHLRAAAIKRSSHYDFDIVEQTREVCELVFWERSLPAGGEVRKGVPGWVRKKEPIRMTMAEAVKNPDGSKGIAISRKTGLVKDNWASASDDMLFARCISKMYRRYAADLSSGVLAYDPDEMDRDSVPPAIEVRQPDPAPATSLPAAPPPGLPAPAPAQAQAAPPINTIQMAEIDALAEKLAIPQQAFRARVKQLYGTEDATQITGPQADDLIGKLSGALKAKEASAGQPAGAGK